MNRKKVAVGISGGVDSAVSALLLKRAGYDVVGVHLYCWPPKSEVEKDGVTREEWIRKNGCRADEDRASALKTCLELGIPFKLLDFSEEYNQRVIRYFYDEYEAGRTPNPDVLCNSEIKFGLFLDWAMENGFDHIATGHYAKLEKTQKLENSKTLNTESLNPIRLTIPKDKHKDQTYFLWKLTQKELGQVLFPLGDLVKHEVRKIAKEAGLSVADKKDSQGICFVGNVEVREFLARRLKEKHGVVLDTEGNNVGTHDGVSFYTIGQRGGWVMDAKTQKIKKSKTQDGETPVFYVISKDAKSNTLVVGEAIEATKDMFEVAEINQTNPKKDIVTTKELYVRIRHGGELLRARAQTQGNGLVVVLDKEMRGVAPGQSAVFYGGEGECLGGGVIL